MDEVDVAAHLFDRAVDVKALAGHDDRGRQVVLVDEPDPGLRVRVRRHQPDQHGDHHRIEDEDGDERGRAPQDEQVLAQEEIGAHGALYQAKIAAASDRWYSSKGPSKSSRPSRRTATRSATCSRSSTFCVARTTAPRASRSCDADSHSLRRCTGSSDAVGSSSRSTCGSPSMVIARLSRWRLPTDRAEEGRSSSGSPYAKTRRSAAPFGSGSPSSRAKSTRFCR